MKSKELFTASELAMRYIAEASSLGWPPGHWPAVFSTDLGNGKDCFLANKKPDGTRVYHQLGTPLEIYVLND